MVQQGLYDPQNVTHRYGCKGTDLLDGTKVCYRHCITYVYEPLLKSALEQFKIRWNTHSIRLNKLAGCPPGVPDDLYHLPVLSGSLHYIT